jgi:hypothetical protein
MAKKTATGFRKGDAVAVIASWDGNGTVSIRRATVHSSGPKVLRLLDPTTGETFRSMFTEHDVKSSIGEGFRTVVLDETDAGLEAKPVHLMTPQQRGILAAPTESFAAKVERIREELTTTATLRERARLAAERLEWLTAAQLLRRAEAIYPARFRDQASGKADRAAMLERATSYERAAVRAGRS